MQNGKFRIQRFGPPISLPGLHPRDFIIVQLEKMTRDDRIAFDTEEPQNMGHEGKEAVTSMPFAVGHKASGQWSTALFGFPHQLSSPFL